MKITVKRAAAYAGKVAAKIKTTPARLAVARQSAAAMVLLAFFLLIQYFLFPFSAVTRRPSSLVVTDKAGSVMQGTLSTDGEWRLPVPLSEMGRWMPQVVVALEDQRFWLHHGIDLPAIARAARLNRAANRVISGASTITSQVIRMSVERPRTPLNKAKEFWQASALELFMTKQEILETYLNITPYGSNIRGVEAASLTWFGKQAKDMTLAEAALLAGILRGPAVYRPDRHPERAKELRDRLIDTLAERGVASAGEAARAKAEPVPTEKKPLPALFTQAAAKAARTSGVLGMTDKYGRLRSTLDMNMQYLLQLELERVLSNMDSGVTGAAVLVENKTGKVRGYIGNAKERQKIDGAWVDCATAARSPGSTMKPFVYALAFESGELTPSTMLADVGGENMPRNFDRMFRGPVSARTALADSLNIPAVQVLRSQGGHKTLDLYHRLSFQHFRRSADWYGESLILGGCEVTALELARAYHTLADGGTDTPLIWAENAEKPRGTRVLSEAASALALDALKDSRRLIPIYNEIFGEEGTVIAFKTGTSYGRRDAWTAAVTPAYTLIIWLGDPSGRPHYSLVGVTAAAPPAIMIMRKLTPRGSPWFDLPKEVKRGRVCAASGAPPNAFCPQTAEDLYINRVSRREPCTIHVLEQGNLVVKWPPELEKFFQMERVPKTDSRLKIISPQANATYLARTENERVELSASGGRGELFWFIDGTYHDSNGPDRDRPVFWTMREGKYKITAADESGKSTSVEITVKKPTPRKEEELEPLEEI